MIVFCVFACTEPRSVTIQPRRSLNLFSRLIPAFHSPYTLPSSVSSKSCVCHSYENCRGVGVFFPFWNRTSEKKVSPACPILDRERAQRVEGSLLGAKGLPSPPDGFPPLHPLSLSTFNCELSTSSLSKSLIRNTYGLRCKCCKQKTYSNANSFRCNTYKKPRGVGAPGQAICGYWRSAYNFNCMYGDSEPGWAYLAMATRGRACGATAPR